LTADGVLVGWGRGQVAGPIETGGKPLQGITGFAASRSGGNRFSLALRSDGTVFGWGDGRQGQTAVPAGLGDVIAICAGDSQGLALKADGTVASWGLGGPPPPGLSNVVAISAGNTFGHDLALTRDGRVIAWWAREGVSYGWNVPEGLSNVMAVATGWNHCLALKRDGTVMGWGFNSEGQSTGISGGNSGTQATGLVMVAGQLLTDVAAIAASYEYSLALKKDGTLVSWGRTSRGLVPEGLSNVVAISASGSYCLAITTNPAVAKRFSRSPVRKMP
jgi:alpha-tubulin suppressor-like RCC1 family protein